MKSETLAWVDVGLAVICVVTAFGIFFLWALDRLPGMKIIAEVIFSLLVFGLLVNLLFWHG